MVALGLFEQRLITERRLVTINHGKSLVVRPSGLSMLLIQWLIVLHQPVRESETVLLTAGDLTTAAADTPGQIDQHSPIGIIALKIMGRTLPGWLHGDRCGNSGGHSLQQRSSGKYGASFGLLLHYCVSFCFSPFLLWGDESFPLRW
jgi:hypothetical protein